MQGGDVGLEGLNWCDAYMFSLLHYTCIIHLVEVTLLGVFLSSPFFVFEVIIVSRDLFTPNL